MKRLEWRPGTTPRTFFINPFRERMSQEFSFCELHHETHPLLLDAVVLSIMLLQALASLFALCLSRIFREVKTKDVEKAEQSDLHSEECLVGKYKEDQKNLYLMLVLE
jgi:hypothetical protein